MKRRHSKAVLVVEVLAILCRQRDDFELIDNDIGRVIRLIVAQFVYWQPIKSTPQ